MIKLEQRKSGARHPASPSGRRTSLVAGTIVLAAGILAGAVALPGGEPRRTISPQLPAAQAGEGPLTALAEDTRFGRLNGRWQRPDGGYVLEIRRADAGGRIDAVYLNPRPIRVARAEATRDGTVLRVFVELRAPNYPGSTYTLTYNPDRDQLEGVYFQAAMQQRFSVTFVRLK
jgi:hypothetical protein